MGLRRARSSSARNSVPEQPFAIEGRPRESRRHLEWSALFLRLLAIAWGGAVVAALLDAFGEIPHLPFITAMGMTAMLIAAMFLCTAVAGALFSISGYFFRATRRVEEELPDHDVPQDQPEEQNASVAIKPIATGSGTKEEFANS